MTRSTQAHKVIGWVCTASDGQVMLPVVAKIVGVNNIAACLVLAGKSSRRAGSSTIHTLKMGIIKKLVELVLIGVLFRGMHMSTVSLMHTIYARKCRLLHRIHGPEKILTWYRCGILAAGVSHQHLPIDVVHDVAWSTIRWVLDSKVERVHQGPAEGRLQGNV